VFKNLITRQQNEVTSANALELGKAPFSRRNFLSLMMASAGSAALAACGGGANDITDLAAAANASKSASADGTTIPPATSITDTNRGVWTITNAQVYVNGNPCGPTGNVNMIIWKGGKIYHRNTAGGFWYWSNTAWIACADPRGTTATTTTPTTTTTTAATTGLFYGLNGHMAWNSGIYKTMTPAAQLAMIKDLGATNYRCDVADSGMAQTLANALTGAFAGSGVSIFPVLNPASCGWNHSLSESAAYTLGYNLATGVTTKLKGLVKYMECGNELDVAVVTNGDASNPINYDPNYWLAYRGVIRGMVDGVRAIDSSIKVGVNVGIPLAFCALQMLWNGVTPNGTASGATGAATVRWDITCYHWYESSGDMLCGWRNNACYDVLQALKDSFGLPIWLTEAGWTGPVDNATQQAAYVTTMLTEYKSLKDKYNIQSVMVYAMIDDDYGLVKTDGVTKVAAYNAYKNFVAANPVA
jgi:hypothetical protein